jgi:hypothetical protein
LVTRIRQLLLVRLHLRRVPPRFLLLLTQRLLRLGDSGHSKGLLWRDPHLSCLQVRAGSEARPSCQQCKQSSIGD